MNESKSYAIDLIYQGRTDVVSLSGEEATRLTALLVEEQEEFERVESLVETDHVETVMEKLISFMKDGKAVDQEDLVNALISGVKGFWEERVDCLLRECQADYCSERESNYRNFETA